jgi:predicted transcriptional regulator
MSVITINVPDTLYGKVKELADRDDTSIEQFTVVALAEKMSSLVTAEYLEERARRAVSGRLQELLAKAPNVEPEPYDR